MTTEKAIYCFSRFLIYWKRSVHFPIFIFYRIWEKKAFQKSSKIMAHFWLVYMDILGRERWEVEKESKEKKKKRQKKLLIYCIHNTRTRKNIPPENLLANTLKTIKKKKKVIFLTPQVLMVQFIQTGYWELWKNMNLQNKKTNKKGSSFI